MARLFDPLVLRGVSFRNRIGVSPMCQYSSIDGLATDWHLVHLGARAVGGAGLVCVEATAVEARGRITPGDMGIWSDAHVEPLARIARFVHEHGAIAGVQLAHAGRKASHSRPWEGDKPIAVEDGGWITVAPSALSFDDRAPVPHALSPEEIRGIVKSFASAAMSAREAGFRFVEIHAAHGYLLHEFLSPLSNHRDDDYGGTFDHRVRALIETVRAVRRTWPDDLPLSVRLSCTDWVEGGWTLEDSIDLSKRLKEEGVDLVDCSSGGVVRARIESKPGYQVPFAEAIRARAGIATAAVGLITEPAQADAILQENKADLILLARAELRDPYWPLHAAHALGRDDARAVPVQYARAF